MGCALLASSDSAQLVCTENCLALDCLWEQLGFCVDGVFGPGREKAGQAFWTAHGLVADGMAGPVTLAKGEALPEIAQDSVAKTVLRPEKETVKSEPMPGITGAEFVWASMGAVAEPTLVWSRVTA